MGKGLGNLIGKLLFGAFAYAVADTVTKNYTGKHIHEHAYEWYRRAHLAITEWAQSQNNVTALKILAVVDSIVTEAYHRFASLRFFGVNESYRAPVLICEQTVPYEELVKEFGNVEQGKTYDVTRLMLEN